MAFPMGETARAIQRTNDTNTRIGFIGLGVMGSAMALNLVRARDNVIVWNRSIEKAEPLAAIGATIASTATELFSRARVVFLMLADETAIDAVLERGAPPFPARVRDHIVVQMGTVAPQYSASLAQDIAKAGGAYVECPVSGSRTPAEKGDLVAMLAGDQRAMHEVRPLLAPMCRQSVTCGDVPNGLLMKFAVNIFLITTVTGLAEAFHFAEHHQLNMGKFRAVVDAGPMASNVSRIKVEKMLHEDFSVQAAIFDVLKNNRLIADEARAASVSSPLLDVCYALFDETLKLGQSNNDMAAVLLALRARTDRTSLSS